MNVVQIIEGDGPLILGQPHGGTHLPGALRARLNARGRGLADTDWHIARLYDGLAPSASVVRSNIHRYVIDANRDPGGASLYPGRNTTALCPVSDFDGRAIWRGGQEPSGDEIAQRREAFHAPYHRALGERIAAARARHGVAILFDCHSIRSRIAFLFDGELPDFSIGTNGGATCARAVERTTQATCMAASGFSTVLNGRFKGGWTTRHYGRPADAVHAIQLELAQRAYMHEAPPWAWRDGHAGTLRAVLSRILTKLDDLARSGALND